MGKILDQAREVIKRIEENDQSPTVRITADGGCSSRYR